MRAKNLLLSIIAVCSAFIVSAENADTCIQVQRTQEQFQKEFKEFIDNTRAYMISKHIIPADSIHLLNDVQKKALQNAKIMAKRKHSKIKLPIELNEIIGESSNNKRYESRINLEDAYFINIYDSIASLVIPLQAKVDSKTINSNLNIIMDIDENKYSVVRTIFSYKGDYDVEYMCLESSVNGFLNSTVFIEGDKIVANVKGKDYDKAGLYSEKTIYNQRAMRLFTTVKPTFTIEDINKSMSRFYMNLSPGEKITKINLY